VIDLARASFRFRIGSRQPQSLLGSYREFLWTPLLSPTFSLLTGQRLDFHPLADYHASHTAAAVRHARGAERSEVKRSGACLTSCLIPKAIQKKKRHWLFNE